MPARRSGVVRPRRPAFPAALRLLADGRLRLVLTARLVSNLGNAIAPVALAFAVLDLGGSPAGLGVVLATRSVVTLAVLLLAGVVADRYPPDRVLIHSNLAAGATQATLAVLLLGGHPALWQVAAVEAVNGGASAFGPPAHKRLVPALVGADDLRQGNALMGIAFTVPQLIGTAAGGFLVVAVGSGWCVAFDAATFLVASGCMAVLRLPAPRTASHGGMAAELRVGWREFTSAQWLWRSVGALAVLNVVAAGVWSLLGPAIADRTVGRTVWGLTLSAFVGGVLVGSIAMMWFEPRRPLVLALLGALMDVVFYVDLALSPEAAGLMVTAALAGVGIAMANVVADTVMQRHVAADKLSRVVSYGMVGSFVAAPLGEGGAGVLAALFPMGAVVLGGAVISVLTAGVVLTTRSVRSLPARPEPGYATVR
jgi:MFS family permease